MTACEAVAAVYFAAAGSDELPVQTHEMKLGSDFAAAAVAYLDHSKWHCCYYYYSYPSKRYSWRYFIRITQLLAYFQF